MLIARKQKLMEELDHAERELEGVRNEAEEAKVNLVRFRDEIRGLEREKGRMLATLANAQARRRVHEARARVQQCGPAWSDAELGRHVLAAEQQRVDPRARLRDLDAGLETLVRLDDHLQPGRPVVRREQLVDETDLVRRLHLRQHEPGRRPPGFDHG